MPRAGATIIVHGRVQKLIRETESSRAWAVWDNSHEHPQRFVVWSRDTIKAGQTITVVGRPTAELHTRSDGKKKSVVVVFAARVVEVVSPDLPLHPETQETQNAS